MSSVVVFGVRILEGIFLVGLVGCVMVLVLTAIEDVKTLLGLDDDKSVAESGVNPRESTRITAN